MSDDKVYSLSNIELLSDLSSPELAELASDFQWKNYDVGSEIIKQGQEEHSFYILIKGKADVMVQTVIAHGIAATFGLVLTGVTIALVLFKLKKSEQLA